MSCTCLSSWYIQSSIEHKMDVQYQVNNWLIKLTDDGAPIPIEVTIVSMIAAPIQNQMFND